MKTLILGLCFFGATAAFGQAVGGASSLSSEPTVIQFLSHPTHASWQHLARTEDLLQESTVTSAHGERPVWEVMHPAAQPPLGDTARLLRKEHETARKASLRWENQ